MCILAARAARWVPHVRLRGAAAHHVNGHRGARRGKQRGVAIAGQLLLCVSLLPSALAFVSRISISARVVAVMTAKRTTPSADGAEPKKRAKPPKGGETVEDGDGPRYFLMKSEPEEFSIDDLAACPDATNCWDGVRNYQARNVMRDRMRVGDSAFFYHSNTKVPGVVGVMEVVKAAYPDHTQFDAKHKGYDAASTRDKPRWLMVDVKVKERFAGVVALAELKKHAEGDGPLKGMILFRNSRLSVQPVSKEEWDFIHTLAPKN